MRAQLIYEKFIEDSDPIHDMGIGRKYLIEKWLKKYNIQNYIINDDYTIDIEGDVRFSHEKIEKLPNYINFNKIHRGHFIISFNNLTSLRGCPKIVEGLFDCSNNNLKSLKYAPIKLDITLFCHNNPNLTKKSIMAYANNPSVQSTIEIAHGIQLFSPFKQDSVHRIREHIKELRLKDEKLIESLFDIYLNESLNENFDLNKVRNMISKIKDKNNAIKQIIQKFNDTTSNQIKKYAAILLTILVLGMPALNLQKDEVQKVSDEIAKRETITPIEVKKIAQQKLPKVGPELYSQKLIKIDNPINIATAKTSREAKTLIKQHEKLKLSAYSIGDGMVTIGWGHAEPKHSSHYKIGDNITEKEAYILFERDIKKIEDGIKRIFKQWEEEGLNVQITQSMFDSMVSMGYNMGINGLRKSAFIQLLKSKDYSTAAERIKTTSVISAIKDKEGKTKYVKMPGLIDRRQKEHELFIKDLNSNE